LRDPASLNSALTGCTGLFHVAANYRLWVPDASQMIQTNVKGTRNIMEAALKNNIQKIIYTSSIITLGRKDNLISEENPVSIDMMRGPYRQSKYLAEMQVRQMIRDQGLPAIIVHPTAPIGSGDARPTPTGKLVLDAARGKLPGYINSGLNVVDVDDVATGHWLAWQKGIIGDNYILGGENTMMRDLLLMISSKNNKTRPMLGIPPRMAWPIAFGGTMMAHITKKPPLISCDALRLLQEPIFCQSVKAKDVLGYSPGSAEQGIDKAIDWYRAKGML